jgi:hypothetical protein
VLDGSSGKERRRFVGAFVRFADDCIVALDDRTPSCRSADGRWSSSLPASARSSGMRDDLAFELRRISSMVMEEREPGRRIPPGPLALRLAEAFGLRGIDVDLALALLGAELDHTFAKLLDTAGDRSISGAM